MELGLSVDELAERVGKSRATVYRYESDNIDSMPISVLEDLARILRTTPGDLLTSDNPTTLTKDEKTLIETFRTLNREGKIAAIGNLRILAMHPEYTKDGQSSGERDV
jgi:transcriptional regulator with XRE-family HTH domain